jgi:hypothetical protein
MNLNQLQLESASSQIFKGILTYLKQNRVLCTLVQLTSINTFLNTQQVPRGKKILGIPELLKSDFSFQELRLIGDKTC